MLLFLSDFQRRIDNLNKQVIVKTLLLCALMQTAPREQQLMSPAGGRDVAAVGCRVSHCWRCNVSGAQGMWEATCLCAVWSGQCWHSVALVARSLASFQLILIELSEVAHEWDTGTHPRGLWLG